MEYKLTQEQEFALTIDRNLSLSANAGSGKTSVLVNRYLGLLINDMDEENPNNPEKIIAITFTNKAASEMLKKVNEEMDKNISNLIKSNKNKINSEIIKLRKIKEKLNYAQISTFHSFCVSLLKEYPIEAGLNPLFEEAIESEINKIINNIFDESIAEWFLDKSSPDSKQESKENKLKLILEHINLKELLELVNRLVKNRSLMDKYELLYNSDKINQNVDRIKKKYLDEFYVVAEELVDFTCNAAPEIREYLEEKIKKEKNQSKIDFFIATQSNVTSLIKRILELKEEVKKHNSSKYLDNLNTILNVVNSVIKFGNPFLITFIYSKNNIKSKDFQERKKNFDNIFNLIKNLSQIDELLKISKYIFQFSQYVLEQVILTKKDKNIIDFGDMIYLTTTKLFNNPEILASIRNKVQYLMVDEFQDTNDLQYNLIKKLCPSLGKPNFKGKDKINLFIVGDPKQSIYRFRNADVRVFNNAINDIYEQNDNLKTQGLISDDLILSNKTTKRGVDEFINGKNILTTTFRLKLNLAIFVNKIFSNIMRSDISEYDVGYHKIVAAKDSENYHLLNGNYENANDQFGKITFLLTDKTKEEEQNKEKQSSTYNDKNDKEEDSESTLEAKNICKYLLNKKIENQSKNEFNYNDFAILYQTRGKINKLIEELVKNNIPYTIHGDKSFYLSREIKDIVLYLRFILNENDDIAFAGLLKSYFFGLTDNDLINISNQNKYASFYQRAKDYLEVMKNSSDDVGTVFDKTESKLSYALEKVNEIKRLCFSLSFPNLIRKMIKNSHWHTLKYLNQNPAQLDANVYKFYDIAREFNNKKFTDIYDFVEEINYLSQNEEEAADYFSGINSVNLLTIHSSKGLEFENVIIYDMSRRSKYNELPINNDDIGIIFKFNNMDLKNRNMGELINILSDFAISQDKIAADAETKRLLYVALTRAKSELILSIAYKRNKNGISTNILNKFQNYTMEGLETDINTLVNKEYILIKDNIEYYKDGKNSELNQEIKINIINESESKDEFIVENKDETNSKASDLHEQLELMTPLESTIQYEDFSATKFSIFKKSKSDYLNRYIYGVPSDRVNKFYLEKSNTEEIGGLEVGILLHSIFEIINNWIDEKGNVIDNNLNSEIDFIIGYNKFNLDIKKLKERVINDVYKVIDSKFFKKNYQLILDSEKEVKYKIPFNVDFLLGTIDILVSINGKYEVWDWKTNILSSIDDMKKVAKQYEIQMKFYVYLLSLKYAKQEIFHTKLLFTNLASEVANDEDWIFQYSWKKEEVLKFKNKFEKIIQDIKKTSL